MAAPVADFLKTLESSKLLAAEEVATLREQAESASLDAQALAVWLVQKQKLTAYQAKQLLAGRWRGFFLGNYKILDAIGQGGMGMVFKAEHQELKHLAAVKVLPPKSASSRESVARFHREARVTAQFDHENVVRAIDVGQQGNTHFIAMEFVPGRSLSKHIQWRRRLLPEEAASVVRQVALGLQHAFEHGVIHRDIKPSNIMVTPEGKAKVLDMGLARFFGEFADSSASQTSLTQTGAIMGTVDYIAPEQAEDSRNADARSDIYSLGCTLYHCLTGQVPFPEGTAMQKLLKHRDRDPTPIDVLAPDTPAELIAVVRRMIAKQPEARYQTPVEVAQALDRFAQPWQGTSVAAPSLAQEAGGPTEGAGAGARVTDPTLPPWAAADVMPGSSLGGPASDGTAAIPRASDTAPELTSNDILQAIAAAVAASPPGVGETGTGVALSTRTLTLWIAGLAATVLCMLGTWYWFESDKGSLAIGLAEHEFAAEIAEAGRARAKLFVDNASDSSPIPTDGRVVLASGTHDLAIEWPGLQPVRQQVTLRRGEQVEIQLKPTLQSIRRFEFSRLSARFDGVLPNDPADKELAVLRQSLASYLSRHGGTTEAVRAIGLMGRVPWPADALRRDQISEAELRAAGGDDPKRAPPGLVAILGNSLLQHWAPVKSVAVSPDGKTVASAGEESVIRIWEIATGRLLAVLHDPKRSGPMSSVAFSPKGNLLASGDSDRLVKLWDPKTRKTIRVLEGHKGKVLCVAFSPDGRTLASGSDDGAVHLWNVADGECLKMIEAHKQAVLAVCFSPDGETVVTGSADKSAKLWNVSSGEERLKISGLGDQVRCAAFSPEGKTLALGSGNSAKICDSETGRDQARVDHGGHVNGVAFSPDGKTLATASNDHSVRLWDLSEGAPARTLLGHLSNVTSLAFSKDGSLLATGGEDYAVKLWDVASGKERRPMPDVVSNALSVAVSSDGETLATGHQDGTVRLWNVSSLQSPRVLSAHAVAVTCLAFSPDGQTLATGSLDKLVKLWDTASEKEPRVLPTHSATILSVAFSPNGQLLASGSEDRTVRLWDLASGRDSLAIEESQGGARSVAFSPDGRFLAAGYQSSGRGAVVLYDLQSGRVPRRIDAGNGVYSVAFTADGRSVVAAVWDNLLRVWDVARGMEKVPFTARGWGETRMAISPDGKWLASCSGEGIVRLCDLQSGAERDPIKLAERGGRIDQVIYTPEGRHLITVNGNGTVYILRLEEFRRPDR